jgi:hypothetical protein
VLTGSLESAEESTVATIADRKVSSQVKLLRERSHRARAKALRKVDDASKTTDQLVTEALARAQGRSRR